MAYADVTRQNLMDAFWQLYRDKDIRDISIKEVTDLAGYHRSTFYHHFTSLQEVLEKIEEPLLPSDPDYFTENEPGLMTVAFMRHYLQRAEYLHILLGPKGDPAFKDKYLEAGKIGVEQQYAEFLKLRNPELALVSEYMFAGCFALLNRWYEEYREQLSADSARILLDAVLFQGAATVAFGKPVNTTSKVG